MHREQEIREDSDKLMTALFRQKDVQEFITGKLKALKEDFPTFKAKDLNI